MFRQIRSGGGTRNARRRARPLPSDYSRQRSDCSCRPVSGDEPHSPSATLQPHNGFIWNCDGLDTRLTDVTASTPQRVHLEPWCRRSASSQRAALQPHNGFIWNHARIGHVQPVSARPALSVSVDPQSPSNPPEVDGTPPSLTTGRPPTFSHDGETDVFKSAAEPTGRYEPRDDPRVSGV